ncbi:hypothetical protein F01_350055 [Burkholderia cenocepacia]|nr:hypothetical protein F01_350055 [Burkholderia cenocepacia]
MGAAHARRVDVRAVAARGGPARHPRGRPRAALGARQRRVEACAPPRDGHPVRRHSASLTIRLFGSFQFTVKYL